MEQANRRVNRSAAQIAVRKAAAEARMERIRDLFLDRGWRFLGVTEGYQDTFVRHLGPDSAENQVTKLVGAGQLKFRRGEQYARVGFVWTRIWRFDGSAASDRVKIRNTEETELAEILSQRRGRSH